MKDSVFQKPAENAFFDVPHQGVLRPDDFNKDFEFYRHPVADDLTFWVAYIWTVSWDFPDEQVRYSPAVLPGPQVNVFFEATEAGVQGVFKTTRTYTASGKGRVCGIAFHPGGFHAIWPHSIAALTDTNKGIDEVFSGLDAPFLADLSGLPNKEACDKLDELLRTRLPVPKDSAIQLVREIILRIDVDDTLRTTADVARVFARSERSLQQLFRTYVGIGLKWVLLRKRLLVAAHQAGQVEPPRWAELAFDLGYASQAHLITDFKRTTGMTPLEYWNLLNK